MFKNLVQLYAMAVCFLLALVFIVVIPLAITEVVNLWCPESRSAVWEFNSNDSYLLRKKRLSGDGIVKEVNSWKPTEVTENREVERAVYLADYRHNQINALCNSFIWLTISGLFFGAHWYLYKKEARKK